MERSDDSRCTVGSSEGTQAISIGSCFDFEARRRGYSQRRAFLTSPFHSRWTSAGKDDLKDLRIEPSDIQEPMLALLVQPSHDEQELVDPDDLLVSLDW